MMPTAIPCLQEPGVEWKLALAQALERKGPSAEVHIRMAFLTYRGLVRQIGGMLPVANSVVASACGKRSFAQRPTSIRYRYSASRLPRMFPDEFEIRLGQPERVTVRVTV
jgi:hypothetical protein